MSCSCCHTNPCSCSSACDPINESLTSQLNNFTNEFFGTLTKTCVNNQVVWELPCNLDDGLPCYPRLPDEGLACYFLRIFDLFGIVASGVWDVNVTYCKNALVTFNGSAYIALATTIGEQPDVSLSAWQVYVMGGSGGGADTASNLGAGNGVFSSKVANDFQFKSLIAGTNVTIGSSGTDLTISSASAGVLPIIILQDQKGSSTGGGSVNIGAFHHRDLNTIVVDTGSNCVSLVSNEFVLNTGTYYVRATAAFNNTRQSIITIRNVTSSTNLLIGEAMDVNPCGTCEVQGVITVAAAQLLHVGYWATTTSFTNVDEGRPISAGVNECYVTVYLEKRS